MKTQTKLLCNRSNECSEEACSAKLGTPIKEEDWIGIRVIAGTHGVILNANKVEINCPRVSGTVVMTRVIEPSLDDRSKFISIWR